MSNKEVTNKTETEINAEPQEVAVDAIEALRNQCDLLGITYHHKNKEQTLIELIQAHHDKMKVAEEKVPATEVEILNAARKEALRLHRVMVTCNDPMKINYPGEVFQAGNANIATIKKYCPFGNTNGWHMPKILLNSIEDKEFRRPNKDQRDARSGGMAKAYTVTYLDNLKPEEFEQLKQIQEMRRSAQTGY